ncbi:MAG TPA: 2-phospho-L-lactate transferase [Acidimicrobiales bacterium]|nr:2-phospho-L-lactate transferase [Acidimicrobiales bacterium]
MITAIAGGVGAARFLRGLARVVPSAEITAVVNTGDDLVLHGLHISPDIDTVLYTLAGRNDDERGWGLRDESWRVMEALEGLGGEAWFRLGDLDLATHLYRTHRLAEGAALSAVTAELATAQGVGMRVLPMSDDPVRTRVTLLAGPEVSFQEYFVRRHHDVAVSGVRFDGVDRAAPAPGVLESIGDAHVVVVCPSNPIVSIGPVVAVPGLGPALAARRDRVVAVSPIVAGAALKGPADRMLRELGHPASVVGVARLYAPFVATLVVDEADADQVEAVEASGIRCVVAPTIMHGVAEAAALARAALGAAVAP